VAPLQIALGKGLVGTGAAAVYHYQVNLSHTLHGTLSTLLAGGHQALLLQGVAKVGV